MHCRTHLAHADDVDDSPHVHAVRGTAVALPDASDKLRAGQRTGVRTAHDGVSTGAEAPHLGRVLGQLAQDACCQVVVEYEQSAPSSLATGTSERTWHNVDTQDVPRLAVRNQLRD